MKKLSMVELKTKLIERSPGLTRLGRFELSPLNPAVLSLAKGFGWKSETVVRRVSTALPEKFEQQIYLTIGKQFSIHPESLAILLKTYRGSNPITASILERKKLGENLVSNSFGELVEYLEECMNLIRIVSSQNQAFSMSMELASIVVSTYGKESEHFIDMIDSKLEDCCDFLGVSLKRSYAEKMRTCVFLIATKIFPLLKQRGVPDLLDPSDIFDDEEFRTAFCRDGEELVSDEDVREALKEAKNGY